MIVCSNLPLKSIALEQAEGKTKARGESQKESRMSFGEGRIVPRRG